MDRINVLDCTLRDGGYCNQWNFGHKNINSIINGLICSNVEIIECGILSNNIESYKDSTLFNCVEQITEYIQDKEKNRMFVCLANYGEYILENLPEYDGKSVQGIRLAFHKKDLNEALRACKVIKEKGYKVFVQPMVSLNYSDEEFLNLVHQVNKLEPYAFYIVDSFGAITEKDLKRLFLLADHNLKTNICIGFHSHNNMQLAYSNAQTLTEIQTSRVLIIDCSVMGMGRGAGNLNTELFVEYLNQTFEKYYNTAPLLVMIDKILGKFYSENYWGYSLANYLSAKHNLHPNYAKYLTDKQTLTVEDIDRIFIMMEQEKKVGYDKNYIENLYMIYMGKKDVKIDHLNELCMKLRNKEVLIIAPGNSSKEEKEKIIAYMKKSKTVTISINFDYPYYKTDYIFYSNLRRYETITDNQKNKCIVTSNIPADDVYMKTRYTDLLNDNEYVRDNAGMLLIKFLMNFKIKKIILAGMDGYEERAKNNYFEETMAFSTQTKDAFVKNKAMTEMLSEFAKIVKIEFLTEQKYIYIEDKCLLVE